MAEDPRDEVIRLANRFGADQAYARAGGGNASAKVAGVLYIKPSGTTLAALRREDLVPLQISVLLEALGSDAAVTGDPVLVAAEAARLGESGGLRPSVEILFHALIPDPLVLHLHPLVANALTCSLRGPELARELLGDAAVWVDYLDPGVPLARGVAAAREAFEARTGKPAPAITLLGNHGIIVSGSSPDEVAERIEWLSATVQAAIDERPAPAEPDEDVHAAPLAEHFRSACESDAVAWRTNGVVRSSTGPAAGPVSDGPMIPDQIVYAGSLPVILDLADDAETVVAKVAAFEARHGRRPVTAVVPNQAAISVGGSEQGASNALDTYLDALTVARDAERLGGVRVLDERERNFIENWEAEAYRQSVAAQG